MDAEQTLVAVLRNWRTRGVSMTDSMYEVEGVNVVVSMRAKLKSSSFFPLPSPPTSTPSPVTTLKKRVNRLSLPSLNFSVENSRFFFSVTKIPSFGEAVYRGDSTILGDPMTLPSWRGPSGGMSHVGAKK